MSVTTTHTDHGTGASWTETIEGATPNSVEVSTTAKGQAQISLKLYYPSAEAMSASVAADILIIIEKVKQALDTHGIPLAGQ
jgi:hypothetical protein